MRRLVVAMLCAALFAAACSGEDSKQAPSGSPEPVTGLEPGSEQPPEPTAAPGLTTEPVEEEPAAEPLQREPVEEESVPEPQPEPVKEGLGASDALLPMDPQVRIGLLDNGLTYYLRNNGEPGTNLALRLAVKAGSLHEAEPGLGVAHFLQHMMFKGTEQYPRDDIVEALRGLGVEFGPGLNAGTSPDATVYKLDVVTSQSDAVETAFGVLSQWAHAATIAEADVIEERDVVRDELRLRVETGGGVVFRVFDNAYVMDTPYEGRNLLGTAESVELMSPQTLRDYYETWYVPSNMAVIAVGDLPVDELEALVEHHFGEIAPADAPPEPDPFSPISTEPLYFTATSPSHGFSYVSLDLRIPPTDAATRAGERQALIETLVASILDARLNDAYEQGLLSQLDSPEWVSFSHTEGLRFYGMNLRADDLAAALGDYWSMVLSLAADGFNTADLELAAEAVRTDLDFELQSVATRQDHRWAELYVTHFLAGADIGTVAERVARVDALLADLRPDELTDYFRSIMDAAAPIVIAVGADVSEVPTESEMRAAIDSAAAGPVPRRTARVSALMEAPEPVEAVFEGTVDAIDGAYEWVFANGAAVVFVPSDLAEAQVDMEAVSQGGWSAMEPGDRPLARNLATRAVANSGVGALSPSQVQRLLEEHNVEVSPFIAETEEGFAGSAAADRVETMFQMLHLLVAAPRIDHPAFAETIHYGEIRRSLYQTRPAWMTYIAAVEARHPDTIEWFNPMPSQEALDALTPESLLERYLRRLGDVDDLIVAVAGDIDRDTIADMARTYIGTLPAGEADTYADRRSPEPAGVVRREVVLPPDNQDGRAEVYFETPYTVDVAVEVAAEALRTILDARLDAGIREELGASYSADAAVAPFLTPEAGVVAQITVSGNPEFIDEMQTRIFEILADLVANGPRPAEWTDAQAGLNTRYTQLSNADRLAAVLRRAHAPENELTTTNRLLEELAELDVAQVQTLAAALFDPHQHITIIAVPG